jgi:hypothetical protein
MSTNNHAEGYYAGFAGLQFHENWHPLELGEGLTIQRTFAHLMQTNIVAFKPPAAPDSHHAGPWKPATRHAGWDVHAELFIPPSYKPPHGLTHREVAGCIAAMIRLACEPNVRFLLESNYSFSAGPGMDDRMRIEPIESMPQYTALRLADVDAVNPGHRLTWVRDHWSHAVRLMGTHADFRTAMDTFAMSIFIPNHGTTLVALWGALEALFSPSTSELRFRVSILIASYLHPPGADRATMQKEIFDLYDKRSAAAHGKPKHRIDHLVQTFNIIKLVLIKMIEAHEVPTKDALNARLLGM